MFSKLMYECDGDKTTEVVGIVAAKRLMQSLGMEQLKTSKGMLEVTNLVRCESDVRE